HDLQDLDDLLPAALLPGGLLALAQLVGDLDVHLLGHARASFRPCPTRMAGHDLLSSSGAGEMPPHEDSRPSPWGTCNSCCTLPRPPSWIWRGWPPRRPACWTTRQWPRRPGPSWVGCCPPSCRATPSRKPSVPL